MVTQINNYKKTHRPQMTNEEKVGKPHQGIYIPKNPEKVVGGEIITRSSWESAFARWCDDNPQVIKWGFETVAIQYRNPAAVDLEACEKYNADPVNPQNWPIHNYYPDVYCEIRDEDDLDGTKTKKLLIEIKPLSQTVRPALLPAGAKLSDQKAFNNKTKTYLQNVKKWEAAKIWAQEHNMDFRVFTEVTLEKMGII